MPLKMQSKQSKPLQQSEQLKITTLNLNGLRSAHRKGLSAWLEQQQPDVLLLQEVRAPAMPELLPKFLPHLAWQPAQKAGYSGVAIASRYPLQQLAVMGHDQMDAEGRVLTAIIEGLRVVSVYLPSGSSKPERQAFKDEILPHYQAWVSQLLVQAEPLIIGGDYNIAHTEKDIKNWRGNLKNSGFLPHERQWLTAHLTSGLTDTHRAALGESSAYTWWSQRGKAYDNDAGWRIDYLLAAGVSVNQVQADREAKLSDHAPLSGLVTWP